MSRSIKVSDILFQRLQTIATPFVDTPETVIEKLLDFYEKTHNSSNIGRPTTPINKNSNNDIIGLNPEVPESLKHTRVRQAKFGDFEIKNPNWNKINKYAHEIAVKHLGISRTLDITLANTIEGRYEERGYEFLNGADFSIQGQNSNDAWKSILNLAKELRVPVEVTFIWHHKKEASYPGKRGSLVWYPS